MSNIKYCPKCGNIEFFNYSDSATCEYCNRPLLETTHSVDEFFELAKQDKDTASCKIKEIIKNEYITGNSEFSEEAEQKRTEKEEWEKQYGGRSHYSSNAVHCPYCNSTSVKKITTAGRAVSVGVFGLASKKIGKQWHCNKCGSDF